MKTFLLTLCLWPMLVSAHGDGHDHEQLSPATQTTGASILQLDSVWKNEEGKSTRLIELQNQPHIVAMLFTRCETACPIIVEDLKQIFNEVEAKNPGKLRVAIFSLDSVRETPKSLKEFSVKKKLPSKWSLFTADAEAVSELAAALGVRYKRLQNGDYIHSNIIYFLNSKGEAVASKEGLKTPSAKFIKELTPHL